ncbi:MAG: flagellar hook-associated protein FlgK [Dechloromonas sp.]|uniref:Flagellar hook-associated protein 1 n=1 Tax=Candidatus Dechloromonas phosphorivorans TaxID=2899244 RepID=A0A9D7LS32_9RHOO|nr:flagellar hook-associated protein FlgK [Candidatus Dechloromonas phosphorivorans]
MGMSVFGIGVSGMNAAQAGLVTTGHNISNASTAGFSRQQVVQVSNLPQFTGAGFLGNGVEVTTVRRLYSDVLTNQLTLAETQGSQLDAYNAQIAQLANMLGDPSTGLAPRLQDFFSGVADVAAHPESVPSRQALLSSANALSGRFQDFDQQIAQVRAGINSEIVSSITSINAYAQQIASLNHNILVAESATAQQPANDLRDQRDALVAALNQEIRASVVKDDNGSYSVFVGTGQPVVIGSQSFALVAAPSPEDPQRLEVGYQSGASTVLLNPASIQGGRLGGLVSFRANTLDAVQNGLGRVAMGLAQTFNAQHALGQDLNGALGGTFFAVGNPVALASSNNAGTAGVTAVLQDVSALTTSDYRLQYNGVAGPNENFLLTRISDGVTTAITFPTAGYPYSFNADGVTLTISAGASLNDNWLVEPTRLGASNFGVALTDPARIAAAAPIRTAAALGNSGNGTISAGSVSSVANLPLPGTVTLTFNAALGQFAVSGAVPAAGPFAYTPGNSISFNGITFTIAGAPGNGDKFTVDRNTNGVADNRNALALGALQTTNTLGKNASILGSQSTASFQSAYSQLVSEVGNTARQIEVTAKAQKTVIAQTRQAQQSVSGVNLDEEAANLLRYQQAYQASGKMIQIAGTLFQTLLDLGR